MTCAIKKHIQSKDEFNSIFQTGLDLCEKFNLILNNNKLQVENLNEDLKNTLNNLKKNIDLTQKALLNFQKKQQTIKKITEKYNQMATDLDLYKKENTKLNRLIIELLKNEEDNFLFVDPNNFKQKKLLEEIIKNKTVQEKNQNIQQIQNI